MNKSFDDKYKLMFKFTTFILLFSVNALINLDVLAQNWFETNKLTPNHDLSFKTENYNSQFDYFAENVVVSGNFASVSYVGNESDSAGLYNTTQNRGAVMIYKKVQNSWQFHKKIVPPKMDHDINFNSAIAIEGDLLVIGSLSNSQIVNGQNYYNLGEVFIYKMNKGGFENWGLYQTLLPPNLVNNLKFSQDIKLSNGKIAITSRRYGYIFEELTIDGVTKYQNIQNLDIQEWYGETNIAFENNTVVISAPFLNIQSIGNEIGRSFIFSKNQTPNNWSLNKIVNSVNPAVNDPFSTNRLGKSVSIDGDLIAISEPGAERINIFERNTGGEGNWGLIKQILKNDATIYGNYGISIILKNNELFVGCSQTEPLIITPIPNYSGLIFVYKKDQNGINNWGEYQRIYANDRLSGNKFGSAICMNTNNELLVSSPGVDLDISILTQKHNMGAFYNIVKNNINYYEQSQKIIKKEIPEGIGFGYNTIIDKNYSLVYSLINYDDLNLENTHYTYGAIELFKKNNNVWQSIKKIIPTDGNFFYKGYTIKDSLIYIFENIRSNLNRGKLNIYSKNFGGPDNWGLIKSITLSNLIGYQLIYPKIAVDNDDVVITTYLSSYILNRNYGGSNNWGLVQSFNSKDFSEHFDVKGLALKNGILAFAARGTEIINGSTYYDYRYVYIYKKDPLSNLWSQTQKIMPPLPPISESWRTFGESLDLNNNNNLLAIGGYFESLPKLGTTAIFNKQQDGNFSFLKQLENTDIESYSANFQGVSMKFLDDNKIIIGTPGYSSYLEFDSTGVHKYGAVFIFAQNYGGLNNWGLEKFLRSSYGKTRDGFGGSLSFNDGIISIGAPNNETTADGNPYIVGGGAVYFYSQTDPNLFYTIKSGFWDDQSVWSSNQVPNNLKNAIISPGHIITVPLNFNANVKTIENNGEIILENNATITLN